MLSQDNLHSAIEKEESKSSKQKVEHTYQDILRKAEAEESAKESLFKLAQLRTKYEGKTWRIIEIKETFEKALVTATQEQHEDLISYLKLILSMTTIDEKKDTDNKKNTATKNEETSRDKNSIYSALMSAAIEIDNNFLIKLLLKKVKLSEFQLEMACHSGKLELAKFILNNIDLNNYKYWELIPYNNLNIKANWEGSGFFGLKEAIKNLEIAEIFISKPQFDINLNFFDADDEDLNKIMKEPLYVEDYEKYANTLLTYIIVQKTWLATALLKEQYGTDIPKKPNFISLLNTVLNAKSKPLNKDDSFKNVAVTIIQKLTKIFNALVQREDILLNARSYYAGATPLHMAVYCGDHPSVHALVLAGADTTRVDNQLVRVKANHYIMYSSNFRDVYTRFENKDYAHHHLSPLESAVSLQDQWLICYFLALHDYPEKLFNPLPHFSNKNWASEIRNSLKEIARELDAPTRVRQSARQGHIFSELPNELNRYILSFLPSRKIIPQDRILRMLENVPGLYQQLRAILDPSKLIRGEIDHKKPSLERHNYINFVKEQTDLKIYAAQQEESEQSLQMSL